MYFLADFARTEGAKDKKPRKKRGLLEGAATAGAAAGGVGLLAPATALGTYGGVQGYKITGDTLRDSVVGKTLDRYDAFRNQVIEDATPKTSLGKLNPTKKPGFYRKILPETPVLPKGKLPLKTRMIHAAIGQGLGGAHGLAIGSSLMLPAAGLGAAGYLGYRGVKAGVSAIAHKFKRKNK